MNAATKSPAIANAPEARWSELREILGPGQFHQDSAEPEICGIHPAAVAEPANEQQLAAALRWADANGVAVIPAGGRTKLNWGNRPSRADLLLSTRRMNRILEHAWSDLTVSAEAGVTIAHLQSVLAEHGQRLAIDPLFPETATIGGILSTNDSGTLRLRYGGLRDLIIGVTIALADGTLATSGGKVVKNVAGYDLPKLVTGAYGTLGVITRAIFRLHPLPHQTLTLTFSAPRIEDANGALLAAQDSKMAQTGLQLRVAADTSPELDIRFDGTDAGLKAQASTMRKISGDLEERESSPARWNALQQLWSEKDSSVIAKISILPAEIADSVRQLHAVAQRHAVDWRIVVQATGLGWMRLDSQDPNALSVTLRELRQQLESLVVLQRPASLYDVDVWGPPGDAFDLMLAVKRQFDSRGTLNPGRFVGGI